MLFFILLFLLDLVVTTLLVWLVLSSARRSLAHKVKRAVFYLLPVVATLALLAYSFLFTIPKLLDIERMVVDPIPAQTVTVERLAPLHSVVVDGERYFLPPWTELPEAGGVYIMTPAEHSRMVVGLEPFSAE